jgi:uncharacterized protein YegJ (DUF2314 family)
MGRLVTALLAILLLVAACSEQDTRDKTVAVDSDDPEMAAAIEKARVTLPEFWRVFEKRPNGENGFALKVKITAQVVGNRTVRPLFKGMPTSEVERIKATLADE